MSVLNQSGEEQVECPLCMEPLEVDDLNFFPCTCGYQICRFCWHRIRTDENGLCPACRKAYPENPADFKPLSQEEVARLKAEKRHKDQQRKQKITENRKHLANVRVVQRNLVFVVGLPIRLADAEVLKKHEYFGKFGKIHKVVINQSTSYAGSQGPSASAYVTYHKADDALRAIQAVNNISVDGRTIKTSLGTTKYCSHFMKNQPCPKPDCMYLHDLGDTEASFTKEEMQQGKHQEYEKKLHEQLLNTYNHSSVSRDRKPTPSPPAVASSISSCQNVYQGSSSSTSYSGTNSSSSSTSCTQGSQSCIKEAWPSLQTGVTTNSNNNGNNFGLSSGGNGSTNNNNSNNSKVEGSQRRQRFDQQPTKVTNNIHKKRHTSGEENKGKPNEKLQSSLQDEVGNKLVHSKSQHSNLRSSSSHDLHQNLQHSTGSSNNSSSSSSSEVTNGPTVEADSDIQESDDSLVNVRNSCTMVGTNGRQQLGSWILSTNHRTTLFEPDNNSFFSTNNFTKVDATSTGSATTDWPINGLTLTHMPDVLPPVHSSEDWQAAFGFSNSTNPPNSQHQQNKCIVIVPNNQHIQSNSPVRSSKTDNGSVDHGFDSSEHQQSQNFKNGLENKSSLVENVVTQFPPPATSNHSEDIRVSTNSTGHLPQKISTDSDFGPEDENIGSSFLPALQNSVNITLTSSSVGGTQQMFPHSPPFVHQDATILMMHQHQFPVSNLANHIAGSQHVITNGLPPSQATSKFLADFHLRQQQNQNLINLQSQPHSHLHDHSAVHDGSFVGRNKSSLTTVSSTGGKFSMLDDSDFNTSIGGGGGECNVNSENKLQNGGEFVDGDLDISDEGKYLPAFLNHQQKNMEPSTELEYENMDGNSKIIRTTAENSEETSTKDSGRLTDDELGFDPFHETQKALAEMMEKENMMHVMQDQQNKQQQHPHGFLSQAHLHNQHSTMNHMSHQLYQQYQLNQVNHFSHQVPHAPVFGGSKLLGSFTSRSQQQHMMPQQNHRLPPNVSGCAKLLDGLGLGPSHVTAVGPSVPTRTRLPPPGFTTAPNHMNAFGLGIPRAPSNNSSKILPFMGLGNSSSNNGSSSPIPQTMSSIPNNFVHSSPLNSQQGTNQQSILFSSNGNYNTNNHTFSLQNGDIVNTGVPKAATEAFTIKEWPENPRSLLPNLNGGSHSQGVHFAGTNTPPPPAVFGAPHTPIQGNTQKGWSGVGPCTDWTALDPAIVSSSRPHNFLAATSSTNHHLPLSPSTNPGLHLLHNTNTILQQHKPPVDQQNTAMSSANPSSTPVVMPHLHQVQQNNVGHWLRSVSAEEGRVFYSSNVLGGSSADWATSSDNSGNGNGQQQQNRVFYSSNVIGGSSADWAGSSNHLSNAAGQQQQNHVVGSPNSGSVVMAAPPPPGFSSMRLAAMQQTSNTASCIQKKQGPVVNTEMGNTEISDVSQSERGILHSKEEERIEDLR